MTVVKKGHTCVVGLILPGRFFLFLRDAPPSGTPVVKVWVRFYQQSDVRIEPGTAGWESRTLPLCYAVPLHPI